MRKCEKCFVDKRLFGLVWKTICGSIKNIKPYLRGFSKFTCFHFKFFTAIIRFLCNSNGQWNAAIHNRTQNLLTARCLLTESWMPASKKSPQIQRAQGCHDLSHQDCGGQEETCVWAAPSGQTRLWLWGGGGGELHCQKSFEHQREQGDGEMFLNLFHSLATTSCASLSMATVSVVFQLAKLMAELNKVPGLFPRRMAMSASTTVTTHKAIVQKWLKYSHSVLNS